MHILQAIYHSGSSGLAVTHGNSMLRFSFCLTEKKGIDIIKRFKRDGVYMMGKPEVSIILLTYNPQKEKLFCTLKSIVKQTGCSYEIIVSDDGSETTYEDDVKDYLKRESQADFQYLKSENNVGTIKNYLKALNRARGKYSYGISPGDLFHDEHVIRDLFLFCEEKNADICFGDADYYSIHDHSITLYDGLVRSPVHPSLFENRNIKKQKTAFLFGNNILGATYFRKTDIAEKYIGEASGFLTYIEDMSSTLFALGDGVTLTHYPREEIGRAHV